MKKIVRLLGALLTVVACATASGQAVPELINYQGQILDSAGVPLATGDYDLEINLYPVESGGAVIWGPQKFNGQSGVGLGPKVAVVDGRFNVSLGPKDAGGNDLSKVFAANASVFLEVKVGTSSPIAPRQQMVAAPFAFQARTAAGLKGAQILADGALGIGAPPTNGYPLEVNGAAFVNTGGSGGSVLIHTPSAETGMTMGRVNRADIRYDDSTLKLLNGAGRAPQDISHGLAIGLFGNVGIGTLTPNFKLEVRGSVYALNGFINGSDVNTKTNFAPVDVTSILEGVVNLPIEQWRYKEEASEVKHVGPMAQDFRSTFGLGQVSTGIATVDADGVALAAIQGLHRMVKARDVEIDELRQSLAELKAQINELVAQRNATSQTGVK